MDRDLALELQMLYIDYVSVPGFFLPFDNPQGSYCPILSSCRSGNLYHAYTSQPISPIFIPGGTKPIGTISQSY